jgi:hypothetical protein
MLYCQSEVRAVALLSLYKRGAKPLEYGLVYYQRTVASSTVRPGPYASQPKNLDS